MCVLIKIAFALVVVMVVSHVYATPLDGPTTYSLNSIKLYTRGFPGINRAKRSLEEHNEENLAENTEESMSFVPTVPAVEREERSYFTLKQGFNL